MRRCIVFMMVLHLLKVLIRSLSLEPIIPWGRLNLPILSDLMYACLYLKFFIKTWVRNTCHAHYCEKWWREESWGKRTERDSMITGNEYLKIEQEKNITTITLNRPQVRNVLDSGILVEMENNLTELENDGETKVIIITGIDNFCAGANIKELMEKHPVEAEAFSRLGNKVFNHIENMGKPVIAAVNGYALGGGCE